VGLNSLKSLNLANVYPNKNKNKKNNNKVKSKPLELRSRVKIPQKSGHADLLLRALFYHCILDLPSDFRSINNSVKQKVLFSIAIWQSRQVCCC
jgi:hypothetical protein